MKKAQGISINVIIIAAIALLVLVILAVLVIRAGTNTSDKTETCAVQGGKCVNDESACTDVAGNQADTTQASDCALCCPIFTTGG